MCSSRPAPPPPPVKVFVPQPEFQKTTIAPPPVKQADMTANRLQQARAASPRQPLTSQQMGARMLRILRNY